MRRRRAWGWTASLVALVACHAPPPEASPSRAEPSAVGASPADADAAGAGSAGGGAAEPAAAESHGKDAGVVEDDLSANAAGVFVERGSEASDTIPPRPCRKGERPAQEFHGMTCIDRPASGPPTPTVDREAAWAVLAGVDRTPCSGRHGPRVRGYVDIVVRSDGSVAAITPSPHFEGTETGACVIELHRKLRFRPFAQPAAVTFRKRLFMTP